MMLLKFSKQTQYLLQDKSRVFFRESNLIIQHNYYAKYISLYADDATCFADSGKM